MRALLALVLCASPALAQLRIDAAATGALEVVSEPESVAAVAAAQLRVARTFASALTLAANLVAQVDTGPSGALAFHDLGSSLRVEFLPPRWSWGKGIFLEFFPFDGRRIRPVFDFADYWGAPIRSSGIAPVLVLGARSEAWSAWVAVRGYSQTNDLTLKPELRWTTIVGAWVAHPSGVVGEVLLTTSDRGDDPGLANQGLPTSNQVFGGTARLSWRAGGGVLPALDPQSLGNDPARFERVFEKDTYLAPRALYFGLEGGVVSQNLGDVDTFGLTRRQTTGFVDLQGRARLGWSRLYATFRYRPVEVIQADAPGFPPLKAFPSGAVTQAELTGLIAADHRLPEFGLIAGLLFRVTRPASFITPATVLGGGTPPVGLTGSRMVVLHGLNQISLMPVVTDVAPAVDAIASLRFDYFEPLSALLQVKYTWDPNFSSFTDSASGGRLIRRTAQPVSVGLTVQARF